MFFQAGPVSKPTPQGSAQMPTSPLSPEQLAWAEIIFVMEKVHKARLSSRFKRHLNGKRVVCLDIPDEYAFMQPELVRLLEAKAGRFLKRT